MKHAATPLRRILAEPRRCDPDDFDPDEFAFDSSAVDAAPDEGDEYQRNEIAASTGPKIPGNY